MPLLFERCLPFALGLFAQISLFSHLIARLTPAAGTGWQPEA